MSPRFNLPTILTALGLSVISSSAHADIRGYRGDLRSESTVKDCKIDSAWQSATLVVNEDPQPPHLRFDGYVMFGYPIVIIHFSGNDATQLAVEQAVDPALPRTDYTLRLERSGSGVTGGQLLIRSPHAAGCVSDVIRLRLTADKADARVWFDQATALFDITRRAAPVARLMSENRYPEALVLEQQAQHDAERAFGPNDPRVSPYLRIVAGLLAESARYAEAQPLAERALAADEKYFGPEVFVLAEDRVRLSGIYVATGRFGDAETEIRHAIAIDETALGRDSSAVAELLVGLSKLLAYTGRYAEAESLARRALAVEEKSGGADTEAVANTLSALAYVLAATGRFAEAISLGQRQLAIRDKLYKPPHALIEQSLYLLGTVYWRAGDYRQAEPLLRRALENAENTGTPENLRVGLVLLNLGVTLRHLGKDAEALTVLKRAYRIAHTTQTSTLIWTAPARLMAFYDQSAKRKPALAILYGKEAVNALQQLRSSLSVSGNDAQDAFTGQAEITSVYRELADLLVAEHRLGEAQQILSMLKEQELYAFTGTGVATPGAQTTSPLTTSEQALDDINVSAVKLGYEMATLQRKFQDQHQLTTEEHDRLGVLRTQMDRLQTEFDVRAASVALATADPEARRRRAEEINDYSRAFQGTLKTLGHRAVLAQYFILDDHVEILLTTPTVVLARQASIRRPDLNARIRAYRDTLSNPDGDPIPQARALYDALIGPIASDLRQAGAETLMLSLDDTLRYLPFAALHDGHGYLVESFSVVLVNEAVRDKLAQAPNPRWSIWGLGVTKPQPDFAALPYVAVELNDITGQSGVLAGSVLLDQAFTEASLRDGLDQAYPIIHIASHFKFASGSMNDSFLLLGDGTRLTLAQIKSRLNFNGVELLTLSACETALGDERDAHHGDEIEGLGAIAQQAGAKAVLATLWPVADQSTALLMSALYRAHKDAQVDKADALRQAQLSLLHGPASTASTPVVSNRGLARTANGTSRFTRNPQAPYAHPFFWAPFILMGNWL